MNTWKTHLKSKKCNADLAIKEEIISILELKTKHNYGWLKKEKESAIANKSWEKSVISKITAIDDWTFTAPRTKGAMTPAGCQKLSQSRKGSNNPSVKHLNFSYTKEDVKKRCLELFQEIINNEQLPISYLHKQLLKEMPKWSYLWSDDSFHKNGRGQNKRNCILANLLEISIDDFVAISAKRRGRFIRNGLLKSERALSAASKAGANMLSKFRVTKPQQILYEMVLHHDPKAILEYKTFIDNRMKSYDIFSPKLNAYIEMHGRVFHDLNKTKPKLVEIVKKNLINDELKQKIAQIENRQYIVFWDDECSQWDEKIKCIFNIKKLKEQETYEFCKNKILQRD